MQIQFVTGAVGPRHFHSNATNNFTPKQSHLPPALSRKDLQRIVAEMLG